ncbi:ABC transporter substrate-binding (seleno)protein SaoB [Phosphitispora sp. TUW77]|uniref:ABC transporter substrate-binding (seleno)protein SaoB n=1 Tax=Phosphitispora sp. TUW77 TaxID=3152361 RepID=UPI003AB73B89
MKNKLFISLIGLILVAMIYTVWVSGRGKEGSKINIGASSDSGGMIIHYIVNNKKFLPANVSDNFAMFPVKDCCSSTSEWALSTGDLDIALLCPDAANKLIEKDGRFEVVGPVLVNSDIIVVKQDIKPQKISYSQKRSFQKKLIKEKFGPACDAVPMLPAAVPYAFEKGVVDGAAVDVLKGLLLKGEKNSSAGKTEDLVTYVLVVRKEFKKNSLYRQFMTLLKESVTEMNTAGVLIKEAKVFMNINFTEREAEQWRRLKIRYVFPG